MRGENIVKYIIALWQLAGTLGESLQIWYEAWHRGFRFGKEAEAIVKIRWRDKMDEEIKVL